MAPGADDEGPDSFGSSLRRARVAAGLSQAALAGDDLHPSYVSLLESGRREPTPAVVSLLAQRLGVAESDLLPPGAPGPERDLVLAEAALGLGRPAEALDLLDPWRSRTARVADLVADPLLFRVGQARATALERLDRVAEAVTVLEVLRAAAEAAPARLSWVGTSVALVRLYRESGDISRAIDVGEAALRRGEGLGVDGVPGLAALVSTVAGAYAERGDLLRAQVVVDDLLARLGDESATDDRVKALWNAALFAAERGDAGEGMRLAERAAALAEQGSDLEVRTRLGYSRAWIMLQQKPPRADEARAELRRLLPRVRQHTGSMLLGPLLSELARAELLLGRPEIARRHATASLEALGDDRRLERARSLVMLGAASLALGERAVGIDVLEDAAAQLAGSEARREAAQVWRQLSDVYRSIGDVDRAISALDRALDLSGLVAEPVLPVGDADADAAQPRRSRRRTDA